MINLIKTTTTKIGETADGGGLVSRLVRITLDIIYRVHIGMFVIRRKFK